MTNMLLKRKYEGNLDPKAQKILIAIIREFGLDITFDYQRLEGLLRGLCPECNKEIYTLIAGVHIGLPKKFATGKVLSKSAINKLEQKMIDEYALAEYAAKWGVASWQYAISILHLENAREYDFEGNDYWGFNKKGTHAATRNDYDPSGFNCFGIHSETQTRFDLQGYDWEGHDNYGLNAWQLELYSDEYEDFFERADEYEDFFERAGKPTYVEYFKNKVQELSKDDYDNIFYDEDGFSWDGFDKDGFSRECYMNFNRFTRSLFSPEGYDKRGFEKIDISNSTDAVYNHYHFNYSGIHYFTKDKYDFGGFNSYGNHWKTNTVYDPDGFNRNGENIFGNNRWQVYKAENPYYYFNEAEYNNVAEFVEIYCNEGYDDEGYDRRGYNIYGFDSNGYNIDGEDRLGWSKDGYDHEGHNKEGFHHWTKLHKITKTFYNMEGYNKDGLNKDGVHKDTGTKFMPDGYNQDGFDNEGYGRDGRDSEGFDRSGYDNSNYDRDGYTQAGWHRDGFNRSGIHMKTQTNVDPKGFDRNGYQPVPVTKKKAVVPKAAAPAKAPKQK